MISAHFIDRPRMAIVIAVVISLAGLLALSRIPVAQLPDIVPPQVQVSAVYPGASASVLEATVAQPIESKVVGVDMQKDLPAHLRKAFKDDKEKQQLAATTRALEGASAHG